MAQQPNLPPFDRSLEPRLERVFNPLCAVLSENQARALIGEIQSHLHVIRSTLARNEFLDVALAEQIALALQTVLRDYAKHSQTHRAFIVGAARYFVLSHDAEEDLRSLLGFDDDATVLNFVLDAIGRPELKVNL